MSTKGQRLWVAGGKAELVDYEWPDPGPGQMLVKITRSQISAGSEINQLRATREGREGGPIGYTTVGHVERIGEGVEGFRPGDRILAFGNHASHCLVDLNETSQWRSYPDPIPEPVTDEQACFAVLGDVAL